MNRRRAERGAPVEHRHLGLDFRPGQKRPRRYLADAVSRLPLLAWRPSRCWQSSTRRCARRFSLESGGRRRPRRHRSCSPASRCRPSALRLTTPPKSAFLTGLTSVMVPLLAALVYRIKPRISEMAGVLLAVLGLALMTLEGPIGSMQAGDVLTILCAVGFAAHIVTLGHFSEQMPFAVLSVTQVAAAALWSGAFLVGHRSAARRMAAGGRLGRC